MDPETYETPLRIEILGDADAAMRRAAAEIACEARAAVSAHGRFLFAVSGGRTPGLMLGALAEEDIPWDGVHVAQVDERAAPAGDPARNLRGIREILLGRCGLRPDRIHAMPVEDADLEAAAQRYVRELESFAGSPPIFDLIHLGLGADGHTASLIPGDPALDISASDAGVSGVYQGWRRMTLTFPAINRSRRVVWLVTGNEKAAALRLLLRGDRSIPAGRVRRDEAVVFADAAAAGRI